MPTGAAAGKRRPNRDRNRPSATRTERRRSDLQRRRAETSIRVSQARRAIRRRHRQKVLSAVAAVVVVGAAVSAYLVLRPEKVAPPPSLRAEIVPGAQGALAVAAGPASYRVVYRVEALDATPPTITTEDISVQRPFDGRVVIREGEPPGTAVQFDGRSTFGRYVNATEGGGAQVAGDAPTVALGDIRLDASLPDLTADGTFVLRERRQLLGRQCQVYRTGAPLQSLRVAKPTAADHTDACIDPTGLVLEELTVKAGKAVQRLTATEINDGASLDPASLNVEGNPVGFDQGGATFTPLDTAAAATASYRALAAAPDGSTTGAGSPCRPPTSPPRPPLSPVPPRRRSCR